MQVEWLGCIGGVRLDRILGGRAASTFSFFSDAGLLLLLLLLQLFLHY